MTVLRKAVHGNEIWTEISATGTGLEMAAVIIWEVDGATDTITRGRYFSGTRGPRCADINEFFATSAVHQPEADFAALSHRPTTDS